MAFGRRPFDPPNLIKAVLIGLECIFESSAHRVLSLQREEVQPDGQ
jgi:hypothetical protein